MKKNYITPSMAMVNIETQAMLAGSSQVERLGTRKQEIGWGSEESINESLGSW